MLSSFLIPFRPKSNNILSHVWFESEVDGKYVNGVDIISCNDEGKITEFKVMIRPLQGVNVMHEQMKAMLEKIAGGS